MAQPRKSVKLLLVLLGPLVFFGLLEVALRIAGYRYDPWAAFATGGPFDELAEREIYAPDPELLWTLRPSTVIDRPDKGFAAVRTNSLGLRGGEVPAAKEPGEVRVLCLGDSVTFGIGLAEGEPWPDRMAEALRGRPELEGRPVRVVNAAVPGWSSVQGMRLYRRVAWMEPDAVVFWFGLNDAKAARDFPDRAQVLPGEGRAAAARFLRASRVFQLLQGVVLGIRRSLVESRRVSVEEFRSAVRALRDEGGGSRGPIPVFVRFPEVIGVTISQYETVIRRAEEEGVAVVLGPEALLVPLAPAPGGADLVGRRVRTEEGPAVAFGRGNLMAMPLAELRRQLAILRDLETNLDLLLAELPEGSLDAEALFGTTPRERVYSDNCHLTPEGARLAGEALARHLAPLLGREGR